MKRMLRKIERIIMKNDLTKRNTIAIASLVLVLIVLGTVYLMVQNSNTVHSTDEMLQIVKEENELTCELEKIDSIIVDEEMLLLCQDENGKCYAAEFTIVGGGSYKFYNCLAADEVEKQIYYVEWFDKLMVICNNENAVRYEAEIDGEKQQSEITYYPSVLSFENKDSYNIDFYNAENNIIN